MHQHAQASSGGSSDCAQSLLSYKVGGYPIRAPTSPITPPRRMHSNLDSRSQIALADGSKPEKLELRLRHRKLRIHKTVSRVGSRTLEQTQPTRWEPPGTGTHRGRGSSRLVALPCSDYPMCRPVLAHTRRCRAVNSGSLRSLPRLSVIRTLAATLDTGQLAVRNRGNP